MKPTKKKPAKKRPARKAKAKKIVRSVQITMGYYQINVRTEPDQPYSLFTWCHERSRDYFDLRGMEPGDVRTFKVTTEVVPENAKKASKR